MFITLIKPIHCKKMFFSFPSFFIFLSFKSSIFPFFVYFISFFLNPTFHPFISFLTIKILKVWYIYKVYLCKHVFLLLFKSARLHTLNTPETTTKLLIITNASTHNNHPRISKTSRVASTTSSIIDNFTQNSSNGIWKKDFLQKGWLILIWKHLSWSFFSNVFLLFSRIQIYSLTFFFE